MHAIPSSAGAGWSKTSILPIAATLPSARILNQSISPVLQQISGEKLVCNELTDEFPTEFTLNKDPTYSFQLLGRSPTERGSSGLVHPLHSAVTFFIQKSSLEAKTQLKAPTKSSYVLQNSLRFTPSKAMKTSSAMGTALSHQDFGVLHKPGISEDFTHKGSLQITIYLAPKSLLCLVGPVMLGLFYVLNNLAYLALKADHSLYANLSPKAKVNSPSAKGVHTFLTPGQYYESRTGVKLRVWFNALLRENCLLCEHGARWIGTSLL